MSKWSPRQLATAAIIAALYTVMSLMSSVFGLTYGPIQCRFSEALTVLPFFLPEAVPGLFVGCLVTNLMSTVGPLDIVIGSMATLLAAGLPLPRALEVTANVVSNYTFSLAVRQVRQDVERGRPMAESMAGIECFPAMLTEMVGVGERSGALEETLDVIGGYYDNEVSVTTARLLAVLEPAITIALAVLVVLLLLAVYLPMFTLYGGI